MRARKRQLQRRAGRQTMLLTQNIETIGQMSCNPAIGGIGKSHLVAEIDALDGVMGRATDLAGIHFRVLNASKGPAVRATRAQADRALYKNAVRDILEHQPNLSLFQQSVVDLLVEGDTVVGCKTQMGLNFRAKSVVLTTGTFLGGKIHIGHDQHSGGRAGDAPANRWLSIARLRSGLAGLKPVRHRVSTVVALTTTRSNFSPAMILGP